MFLLLPHLRPPGTLSHNQQDGMTPPTKRVIFYMEDTFTVLYRAALLTFCSLTDEKWARVLIESQGEALDKGTFCSRLPKCWTLDHDGK